LTGTLWILQKKFRPHFFGNHRPFGIVFTRVARSNIVCEASPRGENDSARKKMLAISDRLRYNNACRREYAEPAKERIEKHTSCPNALLAAKALIFWVFPASCSQRFLMPRCFQKQDLKIQTPE
jgi:hypothetical protein